MHDERHQAAFEKAMALAAVSGFKIAFGPALLATANHQSDRRPWTLAAMGEILFDLVPFVPSRRSLGLLIPHAVAGGYVAKRTMEEEGIDDPMAMAMGAAVAAGVSTFAPLVRGTLSNVLGVPNHVLALGETYLALKFGAQAAGVSMHQIQDSASEALGGITDSVAPTFDSLRETVQTQFESLTRPQGSSSQSASAGSM